MKQGQHRTDHNGTGEHTDDFSHLLPLGCGAQHVAGLQVLHDVASDGGARSDNSGDEQRGKHEVLLGHAQHQIANDVDEPDREQERGNGHSRNR